MLKLGIITIKVVLRVVGNMLQRKQMTTIAVKLKMAQQLSINSINPKRKREQLLTM